MGMTRAELRAEISEKSKDLEVFVQARELIRNRVREVIDSTSQLTPLPNWSGTDAILGTLDLCIHAMERTVDELRNMLKIADSDKPFLKVVSDEEDPRNRN